MRVVTSKSGNIPKLQHRALNVLGRRKRTKSCKKLATSAEDDFFSTITEAQETVRATIRKKVRKQTKSNMQCPKCHAFTGRFVLRQTRAADEGATVYAYCKDTKCGHQWKDAD